MFNPLMLMRKVLLDVVDGSMATYLTQIFSAECFEEKDIIKIFRTFFRHYKYNWIKIYYGPTAPLLCGMYLRPRKKYCLFPVMV